jgi:hypothetical protein
MGRIFQTLQREAVDCMRAIHGMQRPVSPEKKTMQFFALEAVDLPGEST